MLGKSCSHSDFLPGVLPASLSCASPNCGTQQVLCLGSSQVPQGQTRMCIRGLLKAWGSDNAGKLHRLKMENKAALLRIPPRDGGSLLALSTLRSSLPPPSPPRLLPPPPASTSLQPPKELPAHISSWPFLEFPQAAFSIQNSLRSSAKQLPSLPFAAQSPGGTPESVVLRDLTHLPYFTRLVLNLWTTKGVPDAEFLSLVLGLQAP